MSPLDPTLLDEESHGLSLAALEEEVSRPHPAPFPRVILDQMKLLIPKGRVLDPFGGVGRLGLLGHEWQVTSLEMEPEWAVQGLDNGCVSVVIGDATRLPFENRSWPVVATSVAYGNRLADSYAPDGSKPSDETRRSYRIYLGRDLKPNNAGRLHFGEEYKNLHTHALQEIWRVLEPGGTFCLNVKDFIRDGEVVGVVAFWSTLCGLAGFRVKGGASISLKGDQNTNRHRAQGKPTIDHEVVHVYTKPTLAEVEYKGGTTWWDKVNKRFLPVPV